MDKRTLRSKKSKSRNARTYDRQNQSIFGKVCSTVKDLLNTSWLVNNVSQWMGNSEQEEPSDIEEDIVREDNDIVAASVSHTNKRLRLRLDERPPSIQSSGTQTWPEQAPAQNLYQSSQSSLLTAKESLAVLNGDNHSENSEGSASTSGCSSLVSSSNNNNLLVESPFQTMRSDMRNNRKRTAADTKSPFPDVNNSRSLWSSPSTRFQRRLPTISNTNQPNFNLSSFVGPSKLNNSMETKVSSPFYEGKTAFGGASALRRMPENMAPYQVDKTLRNQIKVREQSSEDSLEGMSSAAKRILLTLEKMATPVADAKKIPNTNTSPVDLSLYLAPPKSRRNSQFTPSISKGPPIANINTIAKLATLKNYGVNRLRNTLPSSPVSPAEPQTPILQPSTPETNIPKSGGGGKIRTKLHQHHKSTKGSDYEWPEALSLPNVPLPISTLPTINFGQKAEQKKSNSFTFSNPIEHDLAVPNVVPTSHTLSSLPLNSIFDKTTDLQPFVFSSPIEHELPTSSKEVTLQLPVQSTNTSFASSVWVCSSCWVQNSSNKASCLSCSAPKKSKPNTTPTIPSNSENTWECNSCWVKNPMKETKCMACETECSTKKQKDSSVSEKTSMTTISSANTWECSSCWVRNPGKESKCMACETERSSKMTNSGLSNAMASSPSTWNCSTCWVKNPLEEKKCLACETHRPHKDTLVPTSNLPTLDNSGTWECSTCHVQNPVKETKCLSCKISCSASQPNSESKTTLSISSASSWECSSCWVMNPLKVTKCMACETECSTKIINSGLINAVTTKPSTWECSSCWVRNPMKEKKCLACETLHPDKDNTPAFKSGDGFKFSSPVQNSPIIFKFGNCVSTIQPTCTTATFNFGTANTHSETITTASGFQFGVPSSASETSSTTVFKFGTTPLSSSTSSDLKLGVTSSVQTSSLATTVTTKSSEISSAKSNSNVRTIETTSNSSSVSRESPTSCVTEASEPQGNNSTVASILGSATWECLSCWVRNPTKEKKCLACEAPHTTKDTVLGVSVSAGQTTPVSSSVKLGISSTSAETTAPASGFKFGISSTSSETSVALTNSKSDVESTASTTPATPSFKFGTVSTASENTPTTTTSFKFGTTNITSETTAVTSSFKFGVASTTVTAATPSFKFSDTGSTSDAATTATTNFKFVAPLSTTTSTFFSPPVSIVSSKVSDSTPTAVVSSKSVFKSPGEMSLTAQQVEVNSISTTSTSSPFLTTSVFKFNAANNVSDTTSTTSVFKFGATTAAPATSTASGGFKFGIPPSTTNSFFITTSSPALTSNAAPAVASKPAEASVTTQSDTGSAFKMPKTSMGSTDVSSGSTAFGTSQAGFMFKSAEKATTAPSLPPAVSGGGFVFGAPKTEAQSVAQTPFVFGSSSGTSNLSTFQPSQPANPTFQFGNTPTPAFGSSGNFAFSNPCASLPNSASTFGASNPSNFALGPKTDALNQNSSTVSQTPAMPFGSSTSTFSFGNKSDSAPSQNPASAFGSSVFGNTQVPSFGASDNKPTQGGFSFGAPSSGVFQFGAGNSEKKPAIPTSSFTFGTPAAPPETNNSSFSTAFTMSTPPSFNFGATSTPAGPFQFAASSAPETSGNQQAPRKFRKAVRRVRN